MSAAAPEPRVGYILKAFPVVSETFILNEIRALEGRGVPLVLFPLKRWPQPLEHRAVREVEGPVLRPPRLGPAGWPSLLLAHARLLLWRPAAYRRAVRKQVLHPLALALRRPGPERRRTLVKGMRRLAWAGWIAVTARRLGVRHLHAHYAGEPLRVAHLVRKLARIPYSVTAHAKDLYTAPPARLRRHLRPARLVVTCHRGGEEHLRRLLGPGGRPPVLRIPHGIDTRLFRRAEEGREPGLILAVGRLTEKKGFDDLLRACALLAAGGRAFRCEIVGQGRLEAELQSLARRLGLGERVRFRGFVPQERLPDLYGRASIFALPARILPDGNRDGIPNVVLEAMASGLAVVATRVGGIPEAVADGADGLLVPAEDPRALAGALGALLDDPALARRLGRRGAARVAALDFRRTNAPLAESFGELLRERAAAALARAGEAAWGQGGIAAEARRLLGRAPARSERVEAGIRRAVGPGIEANAWRPDLERLAVRRLWDEVFKARRLPGIQALLNGSAPLEGPVLDLGCGRGGLTVALRVRDLPAVGLDLRPRNCAVTALRGARYGLAVPAVAARGEALPFAGGSFQAVCCLEVLEHVLDPAALLREIRRILAPQGACAITVINRWAHLDPHYHLWGVNFLPRRLAGGYVRLRRRAKRSYRDLQTLEEMHYYSFREFRRLAAAAGFRVEDPETPEGPLAAAFHGLRRRASLGFNTALLVLRPAPLPAAARAGPRPATLLPRSSP